MLKFTGAKLNPSKNKVRDVPGLFQNLAIAGGVVGGAVGFFHAGAFASNREVERASTSAGRMFQGSYEILRTLIMTGIYTSTGAGAGAVLFGAFPITIPALIAMSRMCDFDININLAGDLAEISSPSWIQPR